MRFTNESLILRIVPQTTPRVGRAPKNLLLSDVTRSRKLGKNEAVVISIDGLRPVRRYPTPPQALLRAGGAADQRPER